MNSELKISLGVLLNLISLTLCIVGFFVEYWAQGDPPSQYKDSPIHKDAMKDLDYEHFTSIGVLRSCVYQTCISNVADGASIWKVLASLGIVSVLCMMASTSLSSYHMCHEFTWLRYTTVASQLTGVILYTVMICLFFWTTMGAKLDSGFIIAVLADVSALAAFVVGCFGAFRSNKVGVVY